MTNLELPRGRPTTTEEARGAEGIRRIHVALDHAPKSIKEEARAKLGRRMPWYDLPEEVE